jgi:CBS domain-containing protein
MAPGVLCVTEDLAVEALAELLVERGISGVPVVDAEGFPIGVVSKTDLLRSRVEADDAATVSELMTCIAFTLPEWSPIGDAVKLMAIEGVHRVPVVDRDGRVTGIVSSMDLVRWLDG